MKYIYTFFSAIVIILFLVIFPNQAGAADNTNAPIPKEYSLSQNYPNPFNPSTSISYAIPKDGFVKLTVYNMIGIEVSRPVNEWKQAGNYSVKFNAGNLPSGTYMYKLQSGEFTAVKKFMILK